MACEACRQRREAIARIAKAAGGTIVFGARRVLVGQPKPEPSKGKDER
jgi:hypothetical protein